MLDFPAPKVMAKALRGALAERNISLTHAQCLDLVARQLGFANWNVLAPRLDSGAGGKSLAIPKGWLPAGHSSADHFRMGVTPEMPGVAMVEAIPGADIPSNTTGVLMQSISADDYRGRRLKLSAELRTRNAGAGTIWLRIDGLGGRQPLEFDNMIGRSENGPLEGDMDWTQRSIVLDVPQEAESVHFGFFLRAPGTVWARGFRLEAVGGNVPVTGGRNFPPGPTNLEFR